MTDTTASADHSDTFTYDADTNSIIDLTTNMSTNMTTGAVTDLSTGITTDAPADVEEKMFPESMDGSIIYSLLYHALLATEGDFYELGLGTQHYELYGDSDFSRSLLASFSNLAYTINESNVQVLNYPLDTGAFTYNSWLEGSYQGAFETHLWFASTVDATLDDNPKIFGIFDWDYYTLPDYNGILTYVHRIGDRSQKRLYDPLSGQPLRAKIRTSIILGGGVLFLYLLYKIAWTFDYIK